MKILFSPSESKSDISINDKIKSFFIDDMYKQSKFLHKNEKYYLSDKRNEALCEIAKGLKALNKDELKDYCGAIDYDIFDFTNQKTQKAILRYNGVGYQALNYQSLDKKAKTFIDDNTIIFSNVFGPIMAKDNIPFYKLKQGKNFKNINIAKFYKTYFSQALDDMLKNEEIIDLRAEIYTKFYNVKKDFYTFKFYKNNKIINHYSKYYRGFLLNLIAQIGATEKISINDILTLLEQKFDIIGKEKDKNKTTIFVNIKE